jgi:hypothetical protein
MMATYKNVLLGDFELSPEPLELFIINIYTTSAFVGRRVKTVRESAVENDDTMIAYVTSIVGMVESERRGYYLLGE